MNETTVEMLMKLINLADEKIRRQIDSNEYMQIAYMMQWSLLLQYHNHSFNLKTR